MLKVLGFCFLQATVGFNSIPNQFMMNRKSNLVPISMSVKPSDVLKSLGNGNWENGATMIYQNILIII